MKKLPLFALAMFACACTPAARDAAGKKALDAGGACLDSILSELFACAGDGACEERVKSSHSVCVEHPKACETPTVAGEPR